MSWSPRSSAAGSRSRVTGDDDQTLGSAPGGGADALARFASSRPDAAVLTLSRSLRCSQRVLDGARALVATDPDRIDKQLTGAGSGEVACWRAANGRAQAQHAAAELEHLLGRDGVDPGRCAVLVRSLADEGEAVAVALAERGVRHHLVGADTLFERTEGRDVLAWLRLLTDPRDATAVVRALARPPIELPSADIARVVQISRRRKLDMVAALAAATESPQLAPEARERIASFLATWRAASSALEHTRADLFVHRLIERLGLRRNQLFTAAPDVVERLLDLARLGELATEYMRRVPRASAREFASYLAVLADAGLGVRDAESAPQPGSVSVMADRGRRRARVRVRVRARPARGCARARRAPSRSRCPPDLAARRTGRPATQGPRRVRGACCTSR